MIETGARQAPHVCRNGKLGSKCAVISVLEVWAVFMYYVGIKPYRCFTACYEPGTAQIPWLHLILSSVPAVARHGEYFVSQIQDRHHIPKITKVLGSHYLGSVLEQIPKNFLVFVRVW